jgi:hypothetical protein
MEVGGWLGKGGADPRDWAHHLVNNLEVQKTDFFTPPTTVS